MGAEVLGIGMVVTGLAFFADAARGLRHVPKVLEAQKNVRSGVPSFTLRFDIPEWGLRRGERLWIDADALIRLGDFVALKAAPGDVVLARYCDELMGSVAGLIVRRPVGSSALTSA